MKRAIMRIDAQIVFDLLSTGAANCRGAQVRSVSVAQDGALAFEVVGPDVPEGDCKLMFTQRDAIGGRATICEGLKEWP